MSAPASRDEKVFADALARLPAERGAFLAKAGCGVVWMAEQEEPVRRRVALKVAQWGHVADRGSKLIDSKSIACTCLR